MKLTRILSLILALLMVVATLAACKPEEQPEDTEELEEEGEQGVTLNLIDEGVTEYVLVRDYKASNAVINAVNSMVDSIKSNIGADITIKECFNDLEDEPLDVVTEKEILIGMTNRPESAEALDGLRSKDYTISNHGTKLVIGGGGEEGTIAAITRFLNDFIAEQGDRFAVKSGEYQDLIVSPAMEIHYKGNYSYNSVSMLGVSMDSFGLIYPKHADNSLECKNIAAQIAAHVAKESGYELKTYKDTRYWCDYEILIGDTIRTDDELVKSLGREEYYIKLIKTEVTYEDGSTHPGGQLIICFGDDAGAAAFEAFKTKIMPVLTEATTLALEENFEITNRAQ